MNQSATSTHVCEAWLHQHSRLHSFSVIITVGILTAILIATVFDRLSATLVFLAIATTLLGLVETLFAIRVGFDRQLLKQLTHRDSSLADLDSGLIKLGFIKPESAGRTIHDRLNGSLRLFRHQALACIINTSLVPIYLLFNTLWS